MTDFEPLEILIVQHLQLHFYFFCLVVQRIVRMYDSCFSVCTFLFAQFEGMHSTGRTLLCKPKAM